LNLTQIESICYFYFVTLLMNFVPIPKQLQNRPKKILLAVYQMWTKIIKINLLIKCKEVQFDVNRVTE